VNLDVAFVRLGDRQYRIGDVRILLQFVLQTPKGSGDMGFGRITDQVDAGHQKQFFRPDLDEPDEPHGGHTGQGLDPGDHAFAYLVGARFTDQKAAIAIYQDDRDHRE